MGVDTQRPPLPAPTEPSTLSSIDNGSVLGDDIATDLSRRTDRTSYSIPEDGSPVTITTKKAADLARGAHKSQTSLLIEYFEAGKTGDKVHSRPSVRVRVTPSSSKKAKSGHDHIQITETGKNRKPSYTRRISLGSKPREEAFPIPEGTELSYSEESNMTGRPPVEIEILHNTSDVSKSDVSRDRYIPVTSDISSMPPDSMLEGEPVIKSPGRRRSRSLEREELGAAATLKAPARRRSRSLSRERITQKVMEKLAASPKESTSRHKHSRSRESSVSKEYMAEGGRSYKRLSNGSHRSDGESVRPTDSSLLTTSELSQRSAGAHSARSRTSAASSINNPKLLQTVEDAIRRLILPELNALKEEQKTNQNRDRFERTVRDSVASTDSYEGVVRRVSKSSSAPNVAGKPKVVLNRDGDDPGVVLSGDSVKKKKTRRSSRDSTSDRSYRRYESVDSVREEKVDGKRSKDGHHAREASAGSDAGVLTAAALRHHDSQSSMDRNERRRKRHSKSRSRTTSNSESFQDVHRTEVVPPLPMQSAIESDLTRDSILSAETEQPSPRSSRDLVTPVREVARGSPRQVLSPSPATPTRTPVPLQKGLGTFYNSASQGDVSVASPKSDKSISTRARAAALAAAGLETHLTDPHEQREDMDVHPSHSYAQQRTPTGALSPIQSVDSFQGDVLESAPNGRVRSVKSEALHSPASQSPSRKQSRLSIDSVSSSPSTNFAPTRKRPEGISLENGYEIFGQRGSPGAERMYGTETPRPGDVDEWFERNHQQNERYRSELDEASQHDDSALDYHTRTEFTDSGIETPRLDRLSAGQDIRGVGANPEFVRTPIAVESAVASLLEPSTISVRSSQSSHAKPGEASQFSSMSGDTQLPLRNYGVVQQRELARERDSPSKERWNAIKDRAQVLARTSQERRTNTESPRQSVGRSVEEGEQVRMGASAIPFGDDPMPEIGHGLEDESEINTNPSIIQGPIGGVEHGNRTHWPYEPTPRSSKGEGLLGDEAAVLGTAAAVSLGATGAARNAQGKEVLHHYGEHPYQPSVEEEHDEGPATRFDDVRDQYLDKNATPVSQAYLKDEGYISAAQPGGITPEPHHKAPKLFGDDGPTEYDAEPGMDDPFASKKHLRHMSGLSHGMSSPLYDSATGKGIDRIQSKDVVALMDHLTVRDAQRNARDTEILVTLVRSAAEMRNSFDEMKKFIAEQDRIIMNNTDKDAEMTVQKILGGPRPQPLGSPRMPRRASGEDAEDVPTRRKNVFRRALKGLSMKNSNDLAKVEDMLMQILGEVEGLKGAHGLQRPMSTHPASLNSYEALRAAPDAGYEPEGRAGTSSSPNQSGYLSNPSSRHLNGMRSGYDGRRGSEHRVSTVLEDDEEQDEHDQYDYNERSLTPTQVDERLLTPTQEARRGNFSPETPPRQAARYSNEQTPKTDKARKHKSSSSSIFGIPKISRWSKTTSSTAHESFNNSGSRKDALYSTVSRSGSNVDIHPYPDDAYEPHPDDRLRSSTSLPHDPAAAHPRSRSPLIPDDASLDSLDDPKYQARRNSLNLQHPQPRPGPTHRHQTYLESQAREFNPAPSLSPEPADQLWGSNPSLALNRGRFVGMVGGNLSPVHSDGGFEAEQQHQQQQQQQQQQQGRLGKGRDVGPLVPPKIALGGAGGVGPVHLYSSPLGSGHLVPLEPIQEVRYSLETERHLTPSPRPSAGMQSVQRKITGPRPMGSRSPGGQDGSGSARGKEGFGGTVRRKPLRSEGSLESYNSLDSETF